LEVYGWLPEPERKLLKPVPTRGDDRPMIFGGMTSLIHAFGAATLPAKVAVAAVATAGVVTVGAPVVASISDAGATEAVSESESPPASAGDPVLIPVSTTNVEQTTSTAQPQPTETTEAAPRSTDATATTETPPTTTAGPTTTAEVSKEPAEQAPADKPEHVSEHKDEDAQKWEYLSLSCGRSSNESGVVCEFSLSELDGFGHYVVKRDGQIIWTHESRSMPGRSDIRFVDPAAPAGSTTYSAYVVDSSGAWAGGSSKVSIPAVATPATSPPTTEPNETEDEPQWKSMQISCARIVAGSVQCNFSASSSHEFGSYILKRDGTPILESIDQNSTSFVGTSASSEQASYAVYVRDRDSNWIGGSGSTTVGAVATD
jgi:hypothetical protein